MNHAICKAKLHKSQIVIIGGGLAGLFTALKLAPLPVTVVTAAPLGEGASSAWAQGGIAAAMDEADNPSAHAADTIAAGAGLVDSEMAHLMAREARNRINDLLQIGVPFDTDEEGKLLLSREAAHGTRRVVRVKGDSSGQAIMASLIDAVLRAPSINVIDGVTAKRLLVDGTRVVGVQIWPSDEQDIVEPISLWARAVVLATGGTGGLYAITTNPRQANGEALAMAAQAGAVIADAEFVQFHPTAIDVGFDPVPLATEALRGEGATLVNRHGQRFMKAIHAHAELAPRDIVARAVFAENQKGHGAFLDCREAVGQNFPERFPAVYAKCREAGIDPVTQLIPVVPAAHYFMGGVFTDANGRSTVDGLWACGEAASTGVHGANRLASNSLLEAVVFAARIAEDITRHVPPFARAPRPKLLRHQATLLAGPAPEDAVQLLRETMTHHVGVVRDQDTLAEALREIATLRAAHGDNLTFRNMSTIAELIAAAAIARKESRGGHFRSDFPAENPDLARRSFMTVVRAREIAADAVGTLAFSPEKTKLAS